MPVTPFHFGPGAFAKSIAPRWFSFRAFVLSQVVIDCETAWNIIRLNDQLHTFFHSYFGVTFAMLLTGLLLFGYNVASYRFSHVDWIRELEEWGAPFTLRSASIAIVFGGWSHVFLDSLMHDDLYPFWPFSTINPMLSRVSLVHLHMFCLWSAAGAALIWGGRRLYRMRMPSR